jgi:hypothetical protein
VISLLDDTVVGALTSLREEKEHANHLRISREEKKMVDEFIRTRNAQMFRSKRDKKPKHPWGYGKGRPLTHDGFYSASGEHIHGKSTRIEYHTCVGVPLLNM